MNSTTDNIKTMLSALPHKLQVEFAVYCCNDIKHLIKDEVAIKALQLVEQWLKDGTLVTAQELIDATTYATFATASAASTTAYYTVYAAASTVYYAANASTVYYAANASTYAAEAAGDEAVKFKQYETHLINSIANLSILEKLIYNINIENKER